MYVHTWASTYGVLSNQAFLIARELCSNVYILYLYSLEFTSWEMLKCVWLHSKILFISSLQIIVSGPLQTHHQLEQSRCVLLCEGNLVLAYMSSGFSTQWRTHEERSSTVSSYMSMCGKSIHVSPFELCTTFEVQAVFCAFNHCITPLSVCRLPQNSS